MNAFGVIAGTFDPIHRGHINFIERVMAELSLDRVYLLVEKKPRHKPVFASLEHRLKMIELAVADYSNIEIYPCDTDNYPISNCLPKIKKSHFTGQIYLLAGHDVAEHIRSWNGAENLLKGVELVVAERQDGITSGQIRQALSVGQKPTGVDPKVIDYINENNLYGKEIISGA